MSNTPDWTSCITSADEKGELLPLSPFYALSYHFGMLLGVDDFETEQAYHRAKMRLHNAWLHREGVVWGFEVRLDQAKGEIRVTPGLALDAAGHELHLEREACLNVGEWFREQRDGSLSRDGESEPQSGPKLTVKEVDGGVSFDAHVVIRFKACLTRAVPSISEPCDNAGTDTAYSRVFETVEILLLPDKAPEKRPPYRRLRLLFGLEQVSGSPSAGDQEVLDERARIEALPQDEQPAALMQAFHRFAAFDEIDLGPAKSADGERLSLFPGAEDEPVVLANITDLTLKRNDERWTVESGTVDVTVRPSHVATTTIQDLLCGPGFGSEEEEEDEALLGGRVGPRVDPASVSVTPTTISFKVDKDLEAASCRAKAFSVTSFDPTHGWRTIPIFSISYDNPTRTVTVRLRAALIGRARFIAHGTGGTPLLGADLAPLAGGLGSPPPPLHDGLDFVFMQDIAQEAAEGTHHGDS